MERREISTAKWHAYVAGFFDGEGSVSIARTRANGLSDYHKIIIQIGQRAEHRTVLDRIAAEFGGSVRIASERSRVNQLWAAYAKWQLQDKPHIAPFLAAIQPYAVVKARQIMLAIEFIHIFRPAVLMARDVGTGRIRGRVLNRGEIGRREELRLAMLEANHLGPPHVPPSILPPLDIRHRFDA